MGPPADYAVLLCDDIRHAHRTRPNWFLLVSSIIVIGLLIVTTYLVALSYLAPKLKASAQKTLVQAPPVKTNTFELDTKVLGEWFSIDFVDVMEKFDPNQKFWQQELFLKSLDFYNQGSVEWCVDKNAHRTYHQWTKGKLDPNEAIPGHYTIKSIDAIDYLFIEWISGDVTIRGQKPKYYVLTRNPEKVPFNAAISSQKAIETPVEESDNNTLSEIQQTPVLHVSPVAAPTVFGKWITIDYVQKTDDFVPGQQQYKKKMMLRALQFIEPATVYWSFNNNVVKQTSFGDAAIETVNGYSARYTLKTIDGQDYLFVDWMTVEVVDGKQPACRYVLKRENVELTMEANGQQSEDDSDDVDIANVLGQWVSVDFVREMDQFNPSQKFWRDSLYLTGLNFENNRRVWFSFNNNSRFQHSWVPGKVESGESRPAFYTVKNIDGNQYMFFEWISGDVTIRGQKPCYYVLKRTTVPQRPAEKVTNRKILIGANYCTMDFIQSKFGPATRREERMLRYPANGVDFCFSNRGILSEVHLNEGYQGQLKTGISLTSTAEEVFRAYGSPLKILSAESLSRKNDERVLYQKGDTSRIYYGKHSLIFWFQDETVSQIVIFKGEVELAF
jgi:hypothetical protein